MTEASSVPTSADDDEGRPYYHERWQRHESGASRPTLALRLNAAGRHVTAQASDAILVVVGDHFAYVASRPVETAKMASFGKTLVEVVDEAIAQGNRALAEACMLLEAGHGRISTGWLVDTSLQPWREGQPLEDVFRAYRHVGASSGCSITAAVGESSSLEGGVRVGGALFDIVERDVGAHA